MGGIARSGFVPSAVGNRTKAGTADIRCGFPDAVVTDLTSLTLNNSIQMKHLRFFAGFAFALALLVGCGDSDEPETRVPVTGVQLDKTTLTLAPGATKALKASVLPEKATDKSVVWSSSDDAVAAVDEAGLVTAVAEGTAKITVTTVDGGKTAECAVRVEELVVPTTGITLSERSLTLDEGETAQLEATVQPEDATDKSVVWSSSDEEVATVDGTGLVTAVAKGTATITAATADDLTATCAVTVNALPVGPLAEGDTGPLHWTLMSDGVLSFSGAGAMPDYNAMSMGADCPWQQYKEKIVRVELPDGLTRIGVYAFAECSALKTAEIPDGVESLGDYAFASSGLERIALPGSIRSIGPGAFTNCLVLGSVVFEEPGLETVGDNAFSVSGIETMELPDGVVSIGASAFQNCQLLRSITIPGSVAQFGRKPFEGCTDLAVTIGEGMTAIADELFYDCKGLKSISIPSSVERIGQSAFRNCSDMVAAVLPEGLKSIGAYAFIECPKLSGISIPSSVENIDEFAFSATGLEQIVFPEGVKRIGDKAFMGCAALKRIVFSDSVESLGVSAFSDCGALKELVFGNGLKSVSEGAFAGSGLEKLTLPDAVVSIERDAFSGSKLLSGIVFGEELRTIGTAAFRWCESLTEVTIPDGVEMIGDMAFMNCTSLAAVTLGSGLKSFEMMTFNTCPALLSVTCRSAEPPLQSTILPGLSMNFTAEDDTLYVPAGSKAAYEADEDWGKTFTTIVER